MISSLDAWHWLVLFVVVIPQALLLVSAVRGAGRDDEGALTLLSDRFAADIQERARRGHSPDWSRYESDLDQRFEVRDDRLRSLSAAALAVGLGGTLLALFFGLLGRGSETLDAFFLVQRMGISLFGSLTGVIVNLVIVLILLPRLERRFATSSGAVLHSLQEVSQRNPPNEALMETVRQELALLRDSLNTEFASVFSKAILGFPDVVVQLGGQVERLAFVVEGQVGGMGAAVSDLAICANAVSSSATRLQPAAQKLAEATDLLVRMPEEMQQVVEAGRTQWMEGIHEQHQEHVRQLLALQERVEAASRQREQEVLDVARGLTFAVSEVRQAVDSIPEHLANEVARASGKLGIEFGREARDHTNDLAQRLEAEYDKLFRRIENHEKEWRNNVGLVVDELFEKLRETLNGSLVSGLESASGELGKALAALPGVTERWLQAQSDFEALQGEALGRWDDVGRSTSEAARKLLQADGQLHVAVEALGASAGHLSRIAEMTENLEAKAVAAQQGVLSRYLGELDDLRLQLVSVLRESNEGKARFDSILQRQSDFIRACIEELMRGRRTATLAEQ